MSTRVVFLHACLSVSLSRNMHRSAHVHSHAKHTSSCLKVLRILPSAHSNDDAARSHLHLEAPPHRAAISRAVTSLAPHRQPPWSGTARSGWPRRAPPAARGRRALGDRLGASGTRGLWVFWGGRGGWECRKGTIGVERDRQLWEARRSAHNRRTSGEVVLMGAGFDFLTVPRYVWYFGRLLCCLDPGSDVFGEHRVNDMRLLRRIIACIVSGGETRWRAISLQNLEEEHDNKATGVDCGNVVDHRGFQGVEVGWGTQGVTGHCRFSRGLYLGRHWVQREEVGCKAPSPYIESREGLRATVSGATCAGEGEHKILAAMLANASAGSAHPHAGNAM